MSFWDERFATEEYIFGTAPNAFLQQHITTIKQLLPTGKVLCLGEGEGRNAVFLAKQGYEVTAVDLSDVGLQKAKRLAQEQGVTLHTQVVDLATYDIPNGEFDLIVSIFVHLPPALRQRLHQQVVAHLAPQGVYVLEAYTTDHLTFTQSGQSVGGPKVSDMMMSLAALHQELARLSFVHAEERLVVLDEGVAHRGQSAVVDIIAKKA